MLWNILGVVGFSLILISSIVDLIRAIRERDRQRVRIALWAAVGALAVLLVKLVEAGFGGYRPQNTILHVFMAFGLGSLFYSFYLLRKSRSA